MVQRYHINFQAPNCVNTYCCIEMAIVDSNLPVVFLCLLHVRNPRTADEVSIALLASFLLPSVFTFTSLQ